MTHFARTTLKMTLHRSGQFVRRGDTEFTFRGITFEDGKDKWLTLMIHINYVSQRADQVELSLLPAGRPIVFDVGGTLDEKGLFTVDSFYGVTYD